MNIQHDNRADANSTDESHYFVVVPSGEPKLQKMAWIAHALDKEVKWELVFCPQEYQLESVSASRDVDSGGESNGRSVETVNSTATV